ncbi:peroxiredoxin [Halopseudomonas phragmitis]|uniref:thioredoxin-dependent peroxiredoxin n=2 Tax=Pseudomonadaceae TaxID=135621 RepID=A0A1V0B559_9GAMM|nr:MULTISPECIES: peroxiredoxin [Pseudomonadaceae]AQZ95072.1 peroxiredoxin [Halopseudomonas phragmitis]RHW21869.1 peroxiredoxin [Pseudomonas jilinensis]
MSITLDKQIPDFSAQATSQQEVSPASLAGKKVVIYFYPKDNTPGCTTEGQDFRDLHAEFQKAGAVIFGVSKDSLRTHENFRAKHSFPFELISDPEEQLCRLFDVIKLKQMYGKQYEGIERSTFLIDAQGVLRREWRKVKVAGHVAEVLEAVRSL